MPSPVIEQLRTQFFSSLGITEYTPITEADAPGLIDQWEQYLYSAAVQRGTGGYQPAPPARPGGTTGPIYVPPNQRGPSQHRGPRVIVAPPVQGGFAAGAGPGSSYATTTGSPTPGSTYAAPPPRR